MGFHGSAALATLLLATACGGASEDPAAVAQPARVATQPAPVTPSTTPVSFPATPDRALSETERLHGAFVLNGTDAGLQHVRARRHRESGFEGYAVLLSERPAEGDILPWRSGDPAQRGSFVFLLLEPDGAVYVAELGHAAADDGRFGVVMEVVKSGFGVDGDRLSGHYRTTREQEFSDDRYTVDLAFEAPIEQ